MSKFCSICSEKMGGMFGIPESDSDPEICNNCAVLKGSKVNKGVEAERDAERVALAKKAEDMPLTTGFQTAAGEIERELDVITAECVFGMNIFRDLFAGVRDIAGGRSEATQNVLRDARKEVLRELRIEAAEMGADAVIGVDLDYSEFSGGGKSMLFIVASGTAVKLVDKQQP